MSAGEHAAVAREWVGAFTSNPHPDLGREGVVCPYMVKALRQDYLTVVEFDSRAGDAALAARLRELRAGMIERATELGVDHIYLINLIVPFGDTEAALKALVGRVHAQLKEEFVGQGFMAGDFWPEHLTAGLHGPAFRPFRSPMPMLGVRYMIPADLVFFITPDLTPHQQLTYLGYYAKVFAGRLNRHWARRLEESLEAAHAAVA